MGKKQSRRRKHFYLFLTCIVISFNFLSGCTHFYNGMSAKSDFEQAEGFTKQGNYKSAGDKYDQIVDNYPRIGDQALFQTGIIHILPQNKHKDYNKAQECFQRLVNKYPKSRYRQQSEVFISLINEIEHKDKKIGTQRKQIDRLEQQVEDIGQKLERMKKIDLELKPKKKAFPKDLRD